ncbi:MAG: DUF927 domain-containing protein [Pirellulales bacterium]
MMDNTSRFDPLDDEEIKAAEEFVRQPEEVLVPKVPVPDDAPPMNFELGELGAPTLKWAYQDAQRREVVYKCRWDFLDDAGNAKKLVLPVSYCELPDGSYAWRAKSIPEPRPLYALPDILERPDATVMITEGEKTRDAAALLFPDMVVTTTMHGAHSPHKTDFAPLAGRTVIIAPDFDAPKDGEGEELPVGPGRAYGDKVYALLKEAGAKEILQLRPEGIASIIWQDGIAIARPLPIPNGWDLADAIKEGWTAEAIEQFVKEEGLVRPYEVVETENDRERFRLTAAGVEHLFIQRARNGDEISRKWVWICSPLEIIARSRSPEGLDWGLQLRITDPDGTVRDWIMPMEMLADDGPGYRQQLFTRGLRMASGIAMQKVLHDYLNSADPSARITVVKNTGWLDGAFVLPQRTIGSASNNEPIHYQGGDSTGGKYATAGSLQDWQTNVARYASGNSRLVFALSAALAGPLLKPMNAESGGFHLRGPSSIGKTTAVLIAASVWGGAGYVNNWRATSNGFEGTATSHSDTLLLLDEIGQCTGKEVGDIAYMLGNGVGKRRATRTGETRPPKIWRVLFISTGEVSISDKIKEDWRGHQSRGGQEVRVIDIPADAGAGFGLFETLHSFETAEVMARHLKDSCAKDYGQASIAFIERLVADPEAAVAEVRATQAAFVRDHCPNGADGQVRRAAMRFGLVAAAGEIAIRFGIFPWETGEANRAAETCFKAWIEARGGIEPHEERAAIERVRHFMEQYGESRFDKLKGDDDKKPLIRDRAGYREKVPDGDDLFYVLPEVFRNEVCRGLDHLYVARTLASKGMLKPGSDRLQSLKRIEGQKVPQRFYVINASIFEHSGDGGPESVAMDERPADVRPPVRTTEERLRMLNEKQAKLSRG